MQQISETRGRSVISPEVDTGYWQNRVWRALAEDRFVLHYQPILEMESGRISHYEVLVRMQNEDGSLISPHYFIAAAERGGLIHTLDRLVISKAVRCLAEVNRRRNVAFTINLSGHAFNDPHLLPHLRQELERHPIAAADLIFEITETAAVGDLSMAIRVMQAIKELGCRLALDDFGSGFSSFYYLKHLPVEYLKIDGSFIQPLADSLEDQIIVRAMSQVATGFGRKTVAECVETQAVLELLREYAIDYAQGFLISKPRAAEDLFSGSVLQ